MVFRAAPLDSLLAVDVLEEAVGRLAEIVHAPLPDVVARLDHASLPPTLYLDSGSPPCDLNWALADALQVLSGGASHHARRVRRLSSVS